MSASIYIRLLTIHKGDTGLFLEAQWDLLMSTLSGIVVYFLSLKYLILQVYYYVASVIIVDLRSLIFSGIIVLIKTIIPFCPMFYPTFSLF